MQASWMRLCYVCQVLKLGLALAVVVTVHTGSCTKSVLKRSSGEYHDELSVWQAGTARDDPCCIST